jgi:hypothetical protein
MIYVYDYVSKVHRKEAEANQNHWDRNIHANGQGEAIFVHKNCKWLKLGGGQAYDLVGFEILRAVFMKSTIFWDILL